MSLEVGFQDLRYFDISFGKVVWEDGFYHVDIGYQRSGMGIGFIETFSDLIVWGKKEDFERAYQFIDASDYPELLENFRKNFIEKFEYGRSLLSVSF